MSVTEAPVREQTIVPLEPNETQKNLLKVRELVEQKRWCRNTTLDENGRMCMIGMASYVLTGVHFSSRMNAPYTDMVVMLNRTIDDHPAEGRYENGGVSYGFHPYDYEGNVCSYNNTRDSEDDILAWIDRTIAIA